MKAFLANTNIQPSKYCEFFVPGIQNATEGSPRDYSGKNNDVLYSTNIESIPDWTSLTGTLATGQLCISTSNNLVFELTTGGSAKGGTEPTWNTTIGGTTSDNGMTWTTRRGVFSTAGYFRSLLSIQGTSTNNAESGFSVAANQAKGFPLYIPYPYGQYDISCGDSMLINFTINQSYTGNTENILMGTRPHSNVGWQIVAVPTNGSTTFPTIRFRISNRAGEQFTTGYPAVEFTCLDGNPHNITIMVDGVTKRLYGWLDGVIIDRYYNNSPYTMNGSNISSVLTTLNSSTISTLSPDFTIGNATTSTGVSVGYLMRNLQFYRFPGSIGLPSNMIEVKDFLNSIPLTVIPDDYFKWD